MMSGEISAGSVAAGGTSARATVLGVEFCALEFCALNQTKDERHNRQASERTAFPIRPQRSQNDRVTNSACFQNVFARRGSAFLGLAKYPNCEVLASILAQKFSRISPCFSAYFRDRSGCYGLPASL